MHEILDHLAANALVLDIGSGPGSFPATATRARTIRVDLNPGPSHIPNFAIADARALPFPPESFDAVILNHSLEHFHDYKRSLQEIGRVLKKSGAAFVAVPDATTFSDRLYRKVLINSGGHINLFDSPGRLSDTISWYFGLPHTATRLLCSSFAFLNRRLNRTRNQDRQLRFLGLPEPLLAAFVGLIRRLDRPAQPRLGLYGWAFYFGAIPEKVDATPRINVCIRCGQGHAAAYLQDLQLIQPTPWGPQYNCPNCTCRNFYRHPPQTALGSE